jgi:hypothetical protein
MHAILFDTNHSELTRRNLVTRPDVGLNVAKARCAMLTRSFTEASGQFARVSCPVAGVPASGLSGSSETYRMLASGAKAGVRQEGRK